MTTGSDSETLDYQKELPERITKKNYQKELATGAPKGKIRKVSPRDQEARRMIRRCYILEVMDSYWIILHRKTLKED